MILIRIILVSLIIYLIIRAFYRMGATEAPPPKRQEAPKKDKKTKGVPRELGEYVDYEEIKD